METKESLLKDLKEKFDQDSKKVSQAIQENKDKIKSLEIKQSAQNKIDLESEDGFLDHHIKKNMDTKAVKYYEDMAKQIFKDDHSKRYDDLFNKFLRNPGNPQALIDCANFTTDLKNNRDVHPDNSILKKNLDSVNTIVGTEGGYLLASPYLEQKVLQLQYDTSNMRKIASTMQINTSQYKQVTNDKLPSATWGSSEIGSPDIDNPTYNLTTIGIDTLSANVRYSLDELEDSFIDLNRHISEVLAKSFSLAEEKAFIQGNGTNQPYGLNFYAQNSQVSPDKNKTLVARKQEMSLQDFNDLDAGTLDGLLDMSAKIQWQYKQNACYLLNRSVLNQIRKCKDSNNNYLASNGMGWGAFQMVDSMKGMMGMLNSYKTYEFNDLPNVASGNYPIWFGDFSYYKILDRTGFMIIVDRVTVKGSVNLYARKRCGAGFTLAEGVVCLNIT